MHTILMMMRKPIAVLISDIHYNLKNLDVADAAMRQAVHAANELVVPFIVAGDLHDTKALLRGECVNALIETFSRLHWRSPAYVIVGNHDLINEKSTENSLEFLAAHDVQLIKSPVKDIGLHFLPYFSDPEACRAELEKIPKGSTIIMHQGLTKAWPGEYCHDHSAIFPEDVADFRVISGHYHRAQDIKCGRPRKGAVGLFSYIGSPYTTSFAEAGDGPKGFQILYDDGLMEQVRTNLRKHVVIEVTVTSSRFWLPSYTAQANDLVWFKVSGSALDLNLLDKQELGNRLGLPANYRLDKIPTDTPPPSVQNIEKKSGLEIMDELIEASAESDISKSALKQLLRDVTNENR